MDAIQSIAPTLLTDACRPQDTLTVHVLASVVDSVVAAQTSSVTGAPLASALSTGDSADNLSHLETRWYIDILDGKDVIPNSGATGQYEGPQVWTEATYAYHPEDPSSDVYGERGYPTIPGMLTAAVTNPVQSQGLPIPWYAVYGNHDATFMGTFRQDPALFAWAVGDRKAATGDALAVNWLQGYASDLSAAQMAANAIRQQLGADAKDHDHAIRFLADLASGKYDLKYHYFDVLAGDWLYLSGAVNAHRTPPSPLARLLHAWDRECVRLRRCEGRWLSSTHGTAARMDSDPG